MTDNIKVVSLDKKREQEENEEHEHFVAQLKEMLGELVKAAEERRLTQFVMMFEEETPSDDDHAYPTGSTIAHWNKEYDFDKSLGYAERLKNRIFLMSEGGYG